VQWSVKLSAVVHNQDVGCSGEHSIGVGIRCMPHFCLRFGAETIYPCSSIGLSAAVRDFGIRVRGLCLRRRYHETRMSKVRRAVVQW